MFSSLRSRAAWMLCVWFLTLTPLANAQTIWYVDNAATGTGNGRSWANAFTSLTRAIDSAQSGHQIWVAAGTYYPTTLADRSATFELKTNVKWYGGFLGTETSIDQRIGTNVSAFSILEGNIGQLVNDNDNVYHVVTCLGSQNMVIDGFTIQNGHANGTSFEGEGGGLFSSRFSGSTDTLFINNCVFRNNYSAQSGAAFSVRAQNGARTRLTNSRIENNSSIGSIISNFRANLLLENNIIARNTAANLIVNESATGQVSRLVAIFNTVVYNEVTAIYQGSSPSNSNFINNILWNPAKPGQNPYTLNFIFSNNSNDTLQNNIVNRGPFSGSTSLVSLQNLRTEPLISTFDYSTQQCSPAVRAALPEIALGRLVPTKDIRGNQRPTVLDPADIGAQHNPVSGAIPTILFDSGKGDTLVNPGNICLNQGRSSTTINTPNYNVFGAITVLRALLYRNGRVYATSGSFPYTFTVPNLDTIGGEFWIALATDCDTFLTPNFISLQGTLAPVTPVLTIVQNTTNTLFAGNLIPGSGNEIIWYRIEPSGSLVEVNRGTNPYTPAQDGRYVARYEPVSRPACLSDTSNVIGIGVSAVDPGLRASLNVYPNPVAAQGQVNVQFEAAHAGEATFRLQNTLGQTLREERITCATGVQTHRMELGTLPAGVYYLQVQTAGGARATLPLRVN